MPSCSAALQQAEQTQRWAKGCSRGCHSSAIFYVVSIWKHLNIWDAISPHCWLLFLCCSERPKLSEGTSGHTNGSQRWGLSSARACGDRSRAFLAPEAPSSSLSLLWSWPFAYAEKSPGAEVQSCGSAQCMDIMQGLLSKVTWGTSVTILFPDGWPLVYLERPLCSSFRYLLYASHIAHKKLWNHSTRLVSSLGCPLDTLRKGEDALESHSWTET